MMASYWQELQKRHEFLTQELMSPSLESSKRAAFQKEHAHVSALLEKHAAIQALEKNIHDIKQQITTTSDQEFAQLCADELTELQEQHKQLSQELDDLLFPPSEHDNRSVYLEIRAGTGGQEAALFAADLLKMYTNYSLRRNWKVSVESMSTTDLGGFREAVIHIKGKNVFGYLKHESGVHRVQRVPATETQGRIHTSTATVAVLPEADEVDVSINPTDLRIDVYRSGGAGGQHVNTTDSAVRITHIPTGVVVTCQDERSQHKNKAKAMKILQSRLLAAQVEKQEAEMKQQRKELVGTGMRAEKVRTYNFPQNRVTDHQVELTLNKLDRVIEGELDEIIDALYVREKESRKQQPKLV